MTDDQDLSSRDQEVAEPRAHRVGIAPPLVPRHRHPRRDADAGAGPVVDDDLAADQRVGHRLAVGDVEVHATSLPTAGDKGTSRAS